MSSTDDKLIPSFVADGDAWAGAIYALRPDYGPELVMRCDHRHHSIHRATNCAVTELAFASRVVELAERYRGVEP